MSATTLTSVANRYRVLLADGTVWRIETGAHAIPGWPLRGANLLRGGAPEDDTPGFGDDEQEAVLNALVCALEWSASYPVEVLREGEPSRAELLPLMRALVLCLPRCEGCGWSATHVDTRKKIPYCTACVKDRFRIADGLTQEDIDERCHEYPYGPALRALLPLLFVGVRR